MEHGSETLIFSPVTTEDYNKLTRPQKIAALLIVSGPDAAGEVLRSFPEREVEEICRHMGQFQTISEPLRDALMAEFEPVITHGFKSLEGGFYFVKKALEASRGEFRTGALLSRIGAALSLSAEKILERISEMEGREIFLFLKREQHQTIAYVLSYIDPAKARAAFGLFPAEVQGDIALRIASIESTSIRHIEKIVNQLGSHLSQVQTPAFHLSGGPNTVANLLKGLSKDTTRALIAQLEESNPKVGAAVKRQMFTFEDLAQLRPADMQRLMRDVDASKLALALKGSTPEMLLQISAALSKRAAYALASDMAMLSNVRAKEIAVAQEGVIEVLRKLEDSGDIILDEAEATS